MISTQINDDSIISEIKNKKKKKIINNLNPICRQKPKKSYIYAKTNNRCVALLCSGRFELKTYATQGSSMVCRPTVLK